MRGRKNMGGIRDLYFGGITGKVLEAFQSPLKDSEFDLDVIVKRVGAQSPLPNSEQWAKLCAACALKECSATGRRLLHSKLVHSISQRIAVEEAYRVNGHEIDKEDIRDPFFVIGLPRSNGHMVSHVLSRSGLFLAPRLRDTMFPSVISEEQRDRLCVPFAQKFEKKNPNFRCVRQLVSDMVDDDLNLNLHVPQSYAWGLLHGLDEYLLQCIQEDQEPVFEYTKRVLKLFQWYQRCGHFSDCVKVEFNVLNNPIELQRLGHKRTLTKTPWLIHSPLGLLNAQALHKQFPGMNVIWTHRALASAIPSLCSSLAIHNSMYTGRNPSETSLAQIGEKVLGMFGSGTESAIDYFASFEKQKMVHWSNRDTSRHCIRLMMKTMEHFNLEIDRHRRMHGIDAQTEMTALSKPLHDSSLQYFGLHEGVVHQIFDAYVHQFEEFAFEKKFGIVLEQYESLSTTTDRPRLTQTKEAGSTITFGEAQPPAGHFVNS